MASKRLDNFVIRNIRLYLCHGIMFKSLNVYAESGFKIASVCNLVSNSAPMRCPRIDRWRRMIQTPDHSAVCH
jgi:hypothetical protein